MTAFFKYLRAIFSDKEIRNKIFFTIFIIFIYRLLAAIPLPGVDMGVYSDLIGQESTSQASLLLTSFSGGALETPSIVGLGIGVYITASIIIQLLSSVIPQLEELTKEGQSGRKRIDQITRYLTLPLAFAYSVGYLLLINQSVAQTYGRFLIPVTVEGSISPLRLIFMAFVLTAGAMIIMWLAELITEKGVGNGASIMITIGILATLPATLTSDVSRIVNLSQSADASTTDLLLALLPLAIIILGFILVFAMIVFVTESTRKLPIQYARRQRSGGVQESYLPLKLNQTGVMPIIFASALVTFPQVVLPTASSLIERFGSPDSPFAQFVSNLAASFGDSSYTQGIGYNITLFMMIFVFTLIYIFIAFKPSDVAENLQKSGAFISKPAIRPGQATENYLTKVVLRLSTAGGIFLGIVALIPVLSGNLVLATTGNSYLLLSAVGGTSILIVVSVALDTLRQIEGMRTNLNYDKYAL